MSKRTKTTGVEVATEPRISGGEELVHAGPKRKYGAAERAAGAQLPDKSKPSGTKQVLGARAFTGVAIRKPKHKAMPAPGKFQALIEQTVRVLLLTATPEGELTFRADLKLFDDLAVDVGMFGNKVLVTFYTKDTSTRRLLEGYARELTVALEVKGLKVKAVRVLREPDPNEPPPVPIHRTE